MEHNFAQRIIASTQVIAAPKDELLKDPNVTALVRKLDQAFKKVGEYSPRAHDHTWHWAIKSPNLNIFATLLVGFKKANYGQVGLLISAGDGQGKSVYSWDAAFKGELPNPGPSMAAEMKKWAPRGFRGAPSTDEDAKKRMEEVVQRVIRALS